MAGNKDSMVKKTVKRTPVRTKPPEKDDIYHSLFKSSGIATLIAGEDGTISNANKEFVKLSGYQLRELKGKKKWHEFIVNGDLMKMGKYQELIGNSPDSFIKTYEFKLADKQGAIRDVYVSKGPVSGTKNVTLSFVDITDIIRAKELTSVSEAKYRSVIESTDDFIYMFDRDCRYVFVNGRVLAGLGVTEENIIGKRYGDFHDLDDTREFLNCVDKVYETAASCRYEHKSSKAGLYFLRTLSPIFEEGTRKVKYVAVISKDISDLKKTEEKLKYLSLHDPLTNLYNRAYFEEEMHRLDNTRFELAGLIMCDIDGLKLINDTLGHDKGDELLIIASQIIRKSFRESDVVARVGGDEFAILLPNSPRPKVEEICKRIKDGVIEYNAKNPSLPLGISMGFAIRTSPGESMAELYREADNQMYKEKLYNSQQARSVIVKNLIKTVEEKDLVTQRSVERLQQLVADLGSAVGLPEEKLKDLFLLARFHDIGNVGVHDRILHKEDGLTDDDIAEILKHCDVGHRIALSDPDLAHIADHILKHHEWWDGSGYPLGLSGEDIPMESRIMAIADAYESMTGERPHRKPLSKKEALEELRKNAGSQFDPNLVEKFIQIIA